MAACMGAHLFLSPCTPHLRTKFTAAACSASSPQVPPGFLEQQWRGCILPRVILTPVSAATQGGKGTWRRRLLAAHDSFSSSASSVEEGEAPVEDAVAEEEEMAPPQLTRERAMEQRFAKEDLEESAEKYNLEAEIDYAQRKNTARKHIVAVRSSSTSVPAVAEAGQVEHSQILETFFDETGEVFEIRKEQPDWIKKILAAGIVEKGSTVLVGPGSTSLVPLLRSQGANVVVAHWSLLELASVKAAHDEVRCWHGSMEKLPHSWGTYDAVFLGHSPALAFSASSLLQAVTNRCRVGARVVINQSQGKEYLEPYKRLYPHILLRDLPELEDLESMITNLPVDYVSFQSDSSSYLVTLEVTDSADKGEAAIDVEDIGEFPLYAKGKVGRGFGRGSKQMGIPTANLNPEDLPREVLDLPKGVYFGWVQVRAAGVDRGVHKMVMNIGIRPTFADSEAVTVEVHILNNYGDVDFYGDEAAIVVLGFIRREMKFSSLDALVERIRADIETTKMSLEEEVLKSYQTDGFFRT